MRPNPSPIIQAENPSILNRGSTGLKIQDVKATWLTVSLLTAMSVCAASQEASRQKDCSTLKHLKHKVSCLCGEVSVCSGDICGRPSTYDLDSDIDVVLRDKHGGILASKKLSYDAGRKFCFEGQHDGDYQIAVVLYKNAIPQPAAVFPTNYRQKRSKTCDATYMVEPVCPK